MKCPSCGKDLPRSEHEVISEYNALESRVQNDSRVFYSVIVGLVALAGTSLSAYLLYLSNLSGWNSLDSRQKLNSFVLAIMPIVFLYMATRVQKRLISTGDIRIARASQLEQDLGFRSFRLFPPFRHTDDDYYYGLGRIARARQSRGKKVSREEIIEEGKRFYSKTVDGIRISGMYWVMLIIVMFLIILWAAIAFLYGSNP